MCARTPILNRSRAHHRVGKREKNPKSTPSARGTLIYIYYRATDLWNRLGPGRGKQ